MASPKKHDKLMKHLMTSDKAEQPKTYTYSEESEFLILKHDIDNGDNLSLPDILVFFVIHLKFFGQYSFPIY